MPEKVIRNSVLNRMLGHVGAAEMFKGWVSSAKFVTELHLALPLLQKSDTFVMLWGREGTGRYICYRQHCHGMRRLSK